MIEATKKSLKELKSLEYVEDLTEYFIPKETLLCVFPHVSAKTDTGVIKGESAMDKETKDLVRKPALVVKVNTTIETDLTVGSKVFLINEARVLASRMVKNALEENIMLYLVPIREIAYWTK